MGENNSSPVMQEPSVSIPDNAYAIYQVKTGSEHRLLRFSSLAQLQKDALRFRKRMHAEMAALDELAFADEAHVIDRLRRDGFTVITSDHPQRVTVRDESMRTSDFCLGFGDRCCWVEGCDTRALDTLVRFDSYDRVYTGQIPDSSRSQPDRFLEDLFLRFNTDYPSDYAGRSMSVSDIVVLNLNGKLTSYYVEPVGFKEIPDFLPPENHLKNAEMALEDDYDMIDGIINNGEKKSVREEMGEYRNMIEAYVHTVPKTVNKDRSDLER